MLIPAGRESRQREGKGKEKELEIPELAKPPQGMNNILYMYYAANMHSVCVHVFVHIHTSWPWKANRYMNHFSTTLTLRQYICFAISHHTHKNKAHHNMPSHEHTCDIMMCMRSMCPYTTFQVTFQVSLASQQPSLYIQHNYLRECLHSYQHKNMTHDH